MDAVTILIQIALLGLFVDAQWDCKTYLGRKGQCILLDECEPLNIIAQKRHKDFFEVLRNYNCGYDGDDPKVCCPNESQYIDETRNGDTCMTPDGEKGMCKELTECDYMKQEVLNKEIVWEETKNFMKWSKCNNINPVKNIICCKYTNDTDNRILPPEPTITKKDTCVLSAIPPAHNSQCCGIESGSSDRIISGNATTIDQFPWLAKINYAREEISCGGTLISGKYVLTAGHCLMAPKRKSRRPINVTLGEYNTTNPGRDCVEVSGGGIDCTDGEITIQVESFVVYDGYNPDEVYQHHDIALIRLRETVPYTDFIRPICLPTVDFTLSPPENLKLYIAGWGIFDDTQRASPLKLFGVLPYIGKEQCDLRYTSYRKQTLVESQICVGGEAKKDACKGDSGGPLMNLINNKYEIAGVISFGPATCGLENWPSIYTKVYYYLDWITSNIKP